MEIAVCSGRCGTKFLAELFAMEREVASRRERRPLDDTFHRFCNWYGIPVDEAGFRACKRADIESDFSDHRVRVSFESSAFLSLSLPTLWSAFRSRFVVMARRPEAVVVSYFRKGWYRYPVHLENPDLPPTAQTCEHFHHFLGRTLPTGEEFHRWNTLSRVGKVTWFWKRINREILDQTERLPGEVVQVQKLEEFD